MNIKKVAVIGPECTGKSALSEYLADFFHTIWVPEYARGYLENLRRPYDERDLTLIAHGQMRIEDQFARMAKDVLICDTNLYVVKVWSQFKYGHTDPEIIEQIDTRKYDLYLLTNIDLPWEEDPQREHPHKREELFNIYLNEMKHQSVPYVVVSGEREERRKKSIEAIEQILKLQ